MKTNKNGITWKIFERRKRKRREKRGIKEEREEERGRKAQSRKSIERG